MKLSLIFALGDLHKKSDDVVAEVLEGFSAEHRGLLVDADAIVFGETNKWEVTEFGRELILECHLRARVNPFGDFAYMIAIV